MAMEFIHHGIPMPTRKAVVFERGTGGPPVSSAVSQTNHGRAAHATKDRLLKLLSHPNIASKHWIIRQYDHEVQGGSVIKPLIGPRQIGPSDAAVLRPKLNSHRGVVVGCGLSPQIEDPYEMALAAIDEAVRNVVAVGADPGKLAILDNFCWPSVEDEKTMGTLVRACEACRDAALAYGIPFISGKDSLHNQFTDSETGRVIRIPNTLLISAIGVIDDVRKCITMDLKNPGDGKLLLISPAADTLAGRIATHRALSRAIQTELVLSCHDVSDGGYLTAIAEMCIASGLGAHVALDTLDAYFAESIVAYVVEVSPKNLPAITELLSGSSRVRELGGTSADPRLHIDQTEVSIDEMTQAWRGSLDW
jgi:phosphoribosylformylglycinamidine synthase